MFKLKSLLAEIRPSIQVKNIEYYQQLLNQLPVNKRGFLQGIINSVRKQNGICTPNQYHLLQQLKNGEVNETYDRPETDWQKTSSGKTVSGWEELKNGDVIVIFIEDGEEDEDVFSYDDEDSELDYHFDPGESNRSGTLYYSNKDNSLKATFRGRSGTGNPDNPDWELVELIDIENNGVEEGVKDDGDKIQINFIKGLDNPEDDLHVHRGGHPIKKNGFEVYYGLEPGKSKTHSELVGLSNRIKDLKTISPESLENLKKIVMVSSPSLPITHIIAVDSHSPLVQAIVSILKDRYRSTLKGTSDTKKSQFNSAWDMVDMEKYNSSDPTTQYMIQAWVKCMEKHSEAPYTIRKSGIDGHCGLQSGARRLLKKAHDVEDNQHSKLNKYLVVDDVIVGGSTYRDVFGSLSKNPDINNKNLFGYSLINLA